MSGDRAHERSGARGLAWWAVRLVVMGAAVYGLGVGALAVFQRDLLYFPSRGSLEDLTRFARGAGLDPWRTADGRALGWRRPATGGASRGTVLVIHGNAGHAAHRAIYADVLQRAASVDVCILEYPGYGFREGEPTEASLRAAAEEAMGAVPAEQRLFVVGESLGTGVASWLAGAQPDRVSGVLLVAPYDRLTDVAAGHYPWVPVGWVMRDRYDSVDHLRSYRGPVYVWVGERDQVVPAERGRSLYEAYGGPKRLREAPKAGHEDVFREPAAWWREVVTFWGLTPG